MLQFILSAILAVAFSAAGLAAQTARPNIIFILADDLGYGELGSYGQSKIKTPHLDQLAREGLRFTHFYAGATVCAPSRSVLMTGRHMGHTTVRGNAGAQNFAPQTLRAKDVTVAELLKQAGYRTGLIGKWGLGLQGSEGHPNAQGFDYFYGYLSQQHAHNHFPDHLWRNDEKVPLKNDLVPMGLHGAGYAKKPVEFAGDLFAREVIAFVERAAREPFFLYYAPVVPHANNERTRALRNGMEVPDFGPYQDEPWDDPLKGHAAMVTRLDADIGRLLEKLKALGLAENTVVFFSSDNGPHKEGGGDPAFFDPNGPFSGYKRDHTDGGIRVPFIAAWPGHIKPGTSLHVGYFGDMMATFAELAGVNPPPQIDSISLVPTLLGRGSQRSHPHLYWEFHEGGFTQAVLIDGRWKGIRLKRLDAPIQLYDQASDPSEQENVSAAHPEIVKQVETLFKTERIDSPLWPIKEAPAAKKKS